MSTYADVLRRMGPAQRRRFMQEMYPSLPARVRDDIDRVLGAEFDVGIRANPYTLARWLEPDQVQDWPSSRLLGQKVRDALDGTSRFQVWNAPAQTVGKSTWMLYGALWCLDQRPEGSLMYLTYGSSLARKGSVFIRQLARKHRDRLRFSLSHSLDTQEEWLTDQGGGFLARGLSAGVAGHGASLGVFVDDPLKNWQEAHSETARDAVWNEIVAVARLRLAEGAFFILGHTRWHLDDPTGRLAELAKEVGLEIEYVTLPMLASEDDILGRAPGEPLERFTLQEAMERAKFLGPYLTAALEQQDPQAEEGGEVKRGWWKWETTMPERYDQMLTSWDMKLKDKRSGDYVVGQVWGRVGSHFYCLDQVRGQWAMAQTKVAIALLHHRYPDVGTHVIENSGYGPEVMEQLRAPDPDYVLSDEMCGDLGITADERDAVQAVMRRGVPGLVPENPKDSKIVRARAVSGLIEAGDVHLPEGKGWALALVGEWAGFPPKSGGHDDMVDATSQALARLRRLDAKVTAPSGTVTSAAPNARAVASVATLIRR